MKLGFTPEIISVGTMGINSKGQVVYGYTPGGVENIRPFVWLPSADAQYGGMPAGLHDVIGGVTLPAVGREINVNGKIAGQSGALGDRGTGRVWTLGWSSGSSAISVQTIGAFGAPPGHTQWSNGWSINDQDPPVVVGYTSDADDCTCMGNPPDDLVRRAFRAVMPSSGSPTLTELHGGVSQSRAFDVSTPGAGGTLRVGGQINCGGAGSGGECPTINICVPNDYQATLWQPTSPTTLADLSSQTGAEVRAVNAAGYSAGWANTETIPNCGPEAVAWAPGSSVPIELGDVMPQGQGDDDSHAEGINNLSSPQVVGWNETEDVALRWTIPSSGSPTVIDLNTVIGTCTATWVITQAHDINDSGWIAAVAEKFEEGNSLGLFAVVLSPAPACGTDTDQDGDVDVDDLLAVINQWGSCAAITFCTADTNFDCAVNVDDLLAIINDWGDDPCQGAAEAPPQTVQDC